MPVSLQILSRVKIRAHPFHLRDNQQAPPLPPQPLNLLKTTIGTTTPKIPDKPYFGNVHRLNNAKSIGNVTYFS